MKLCNMCGEKKPASEFGLRQNIPRGNCRPCRAIEMRNYRKTGSTVKNLFDGKSLAHLDKTLIALSMAYTKHGIKIEKITRERV